MKDTSQRRNTQTSNNESTIQRQKDTDGHEVFYHPIAWLEKVQDDLRMMFANGGWRAARVFETCTPASNKFFQAMPVLIKAMLNCSTDCQCWSSSICACCKLQYFKHFRFSKNAGICRVPTLTCRPLVAILEALRAANAVNTRTHSSIPS